MMVQPNENEKLALQCPHCSQTVMGNVGGETNWYYDEADDAGRYVLVSCERCQQPTLLSQDYDRYDQSYSQPTVIYPSGERSFGGNIPVPVRIAFEEAEACFKAGAHVATPLMCRRCIEAITHDKNAEGRTLEAKLKSMEDAGLITAEFSSWFDMLRQVGNQAAHDVTTGVTASDARDTLEFTHALVEFIYSYRQKFEEFKARREKPSSTEET